MEDSKDKIYKSNATQGSQGGLSYEIERDIQTNIEKFRDPVILGELMYKLLEERENTNRILKNILARIEQIERALNSSTEKEQFEEPLIPEIDENILEFVRERGKVTADDVRAKFNYKGKNAASARLNRLCDMNLLRKKQVGKKVFFFL
ncbi:MAG: hypothetical protein QW590_00765 [Candidatus Bilamarchaeaceae archaeon]